LNLIPGPARNWKSSILHFLEERIQPLDDPRALGESLKGPKLGEYWKYRVGDYRIICKIEDERLVVLVLRIGHRRDIYR
jgi:mRNA interferase RelE/StbE